MRNKTHRKLLFATLVLSCSVAVSFSQRTSGSAVGLNRIEGRVMDESNRGVDNVYVELYNDTGSLLARQRSSGQGRFSFRGMGPGRYTIIVKPFGTNFLEQSQDIEINNLYSRSDTVLADFRLTVDKRLRPDEPGIVGTVFAQEVPEGARKRYRTGIEKFNSKDKTGAITEFEEAIRIFPKYFDALAALGKAHIIDGQFAAGYPYLLRAIDVNVRCSDCYYSLALAFYRLDETTAALKAVEAAGELQPQNAAIRLLQGMIYRQSNDLPAAEKALLTARTLSKKPNPEIHWQLSLVYNRLRKNEEAAVQLEEFLRLRDDLSKKDRDEINGLIAKLRAAKK